jgi:NDP-sugar pyrophosphorylase family protein
MKSIILCAGFGTRLLPLTEEMPKPLFPVAGRPIIDIIIQNLQEAGMSHLGINLHHFSDMVTSHLGNGSRHGIKVHYSPEEVILDTGGGLSLFAGFIGSQDCFVVHTCDVLTDIPIRDAIEFHRARKPLATLVNIDLPGRNRILVGRGDEIKNIRAGLDTIPPLGEKLLFGTGIFIYSREIFHHLPPSGLPYPVIPIVEDLMKKIPGSVLSYNPPEKHYWKDMGSVPAYVQCHRDVLTGGLVRIGGLGPFPGCRWVHPMAEVEKDVTIEGFVSIDRGVRIERGARLKDCVAWEGAVVPAGSSLENCVITRNGTASADS